MFRGDCLRFPSAGMIQIRFVGSMTKRVILSAWLSQTPLTVTYSNDSLTIRSAALFVNIIEYKLLLKLTFPIAQDITEMIGRIVLRTVDDLFAYTCGATWWRLG